MRRCVQLKAYSQQVGYVLKGILSEDMSKYGVLKGLLNEDMSKYGGLKGILNEDMSK